MSRPIEDAIARARTHMGRATLEILEVARALVEAAVHASGGFAVNRDSQTGKLLAALEELIASVEAGEGLSLPDRLVEPFLAALDRETTRWEARSRREPEMRPIYRSLVALRELVFELGLRSRDQAPETSPPNSSPSGEESAPQGFDTAGPAQTEAKKSEDDRDASKSPFAEPPPSRPRVQRFEVEH